MKRVYQIFIFSAFIIITVSVVLALFLTGIVGIPKTFKTLLLWIIFGLLFFMMINEGIMWIKNGKRSDFGDLVFIAFLFIVIYMWTDEIFDSFLGAFSIYLLLGISELKDYEVLNKILYITVITYNIIFFTAILDKTLGKNGVWRDTAFSLSFWIMLILGFIFFGRKYLVIWRFMSPQYIVLLLYLIAWLAISTASKITGNESFMDYIYETLMITDAVIYLFTGPLIDKLMGLKEIDAPQLEKIVYEVAPKIGLDPAKIKIRFGKYPIINAMAYGAFWDMRMGIIAPDIDNIPEDEMKGIVAHELAHLKGKHTLSLTLISIGEIFVRKLLGWPVTYYDYTFAPEKQPFPMFTFILINIVVYFFLYIFVRMFEARADLNAKRAGFGLHLAKGLYTLESFYSQGREIGINTMLLCDEKITEDNRLLDFVSTAIYLDKMVIDPTRGSLMSNFLNSHPPSYHRIIACLADEDVPIAEEAVMPLKFMNKRHAKNWAFKMEDSRQKFIEMVNKKVMEEFQIDNIRDLNARINPKYHFLEINGKPYVFRHIFRFSVVVGILVDIEYTENVSEPYIYKVLPVPFNKLSDYFDERGILKLSLIESYDKSDFIGINPFMHSMHPVYPGYHYYLSNRRAVFRLKNVDFNLKWRKEFKKSVEIPPSFKEASSEAGLNGSEGSARDPSPVYEPFEFRYPLTPKDYKALRNLGVIFFDNRIEDVPFGWGKPKKSKKPEKNRDWELVPLFKAPLPVPVESLRSYKDLIVFIREKGTYKAHMLNDIFLGDNFSELKFSIIPINLEIHEEKVSDNEKSTDTTESGPKDSVIVLMESIDGRHRGGLSLSELNPGSAHDWKAHIEEIRRYSEDMARHYDDDKYFGVIEESALIEGNSPNIMDKKDYEIMIEEPVIFIHNDDRTYRNEQNIFNIIYRFGIPAIFFLKKPVNNRIEGFIDRIKYSAEDKQIDGKHSKSDNNNKNDKFGRLRIKELAIKSNLGKVEVVDYKKIDLIMLYLPTLVFQNIKNISGLTRLIHKFLSKIHPEKIIA